MQNAELNVETIDHKLLVSGHPYLPNDAEFGINENRRKHYCLNYGPQDCVKTIKRPNVKYHVLM